MNHEHHASNATGQGGHWKLVLVVFLAIAAFFLYTEHSAHLYGYLPYLLLAACPLMHLFHRHGSHGRHARPGPAELDPPRPRRPDEGRP